MSILCVLWNNKPKEQPGGEIQPRRAALKGSAHMLQVKANKPLKSAYKLLIEKHRSEQTCQAGLGQSHFYSAVDTIFISLHEHRLPP